MEHPCGKCGATVEDGVAFCPHCRAPQIRVMTVEPPPGASVEIGPPLSGATVLSALRRPTTGFVWSQALPMIIFGGITAVVAMLIPFAATGPAYAFGGALAVFLYHARVRGPLTPSAGAKIGAASGAFGALIMAIMTVAACLYRPQELQKGLSDTLAQLSARGYDTQGLQPALEMLKTPDGLRAFLTAVVFLLFLMFVIGAAIGGALCAAYLRRRVR